MRLFAARYSFLRLRYIRIEWSKKIGDSCICDIVVNSLHILVQVGSKIALDVWIAVNREDTFHELQIHHDTGLTVDPS